MREHTDTNTEITEPKPPTNAKSREQERPRFDTDSDEPQICRGMD